MSFLFQLYTKIPILGGFHPKLNVIAYTYMLRYARFCLSNINFNIFYKITVGDNTNEHLFAKDIHQTMFV